MAFQGNTATTQVYIHADLALKERAIARTAPQDTAPGRYQPPDDILAFLDALRLCRTFLTVAAARQVLPLPGRHNGDVRIRSLRALHLAGVWQIRSAPRTPGGDSVQARRMPARSRRHW